MTPAPPASRASRASRCRPPRCTPPTWPRWPSPMPRSCPPSSTSADSPPPASLAGRPLDAAETLQLHLAQAAQGAAEGKLQVALGIQLIQRHLGFDVQRHALV